MGETTMDALTAERLAALAADDTVARIWRRDPSVWGGTDETPELADRLDWLTSAEVMRTEVRHIRSAADAVRDRFDRVVLLGMGGSSLAPTVLRDGLAAPAAVPGFHMLDSTHPDAVRAVEDGGGLDRTVFVVASKSGTTIETGSLAEYFWERTGGAGGQFVAVTDPGTPLARLAEEFGFRDVFLNPPGIGGRYSALSLFGLVPAALAGVDPERVLDGADAMIARCGADVPADENPAAALGAAMAEAAKAGRDKLVLDVADDLRSLGLWIEQLVAESTGKEGRGVLPVVGTDGRPTAGARDVMTVTYGGGRGDVVLPAPTAETLGGEFFRWSLATAVAGAVLGVNPFDQPNVAESKRNTQAVLERGGDAEPPRPLRRRAVEEFVEAVHPGDYVAVGAWLPPTPENDRELRALQKILAERLGVVVTAGYGPRFLHSTGQLHKGGPATGHFIQWVDAAERDLPIPGAPYTFGQLLAAQAEGDREALVARGRPVLQIHDLSHFLETV